MITLYLYDSQFVFINSGEYNQMRPVPPMSTLVAPPNLTGDEVAQWTGSAWVVLPERPPAPEPAPEPVPQSITMRQARRHLLNISRLQDVNTAIDNLTEPQRTAAQIDWEYSQVVERSSEFVLMLAPVLGWDSDDLDTMFIDASKLTA